MEIAIILCRDGSKRVDNHQHSQDVALFDTGAGADAGGECALAVEVREVVFARIPEIARWAVVMGGVAIVHAAQIPRARSAPGADVVALLYFHGSDLIAIAVCSTDRSDPCLRPFLALVDPDCASQDREILGLVDVDHVAGSLVLVFGRDVDVECNATQIECPAAGHEADGDVFASDCVRVGSRRHCLAKCKAIRAWCDFHPF